MSEVTKEFTVHAPLQETWDFFVTPDKSAACVPGCDRVEEIGVDVFTVDVNVTVAYTDLTFTTELEITDKHPPNALTVTGLANPQGHIPGSATVTGDLSLDAVDDDTTTGTLRVEFAIRGRLGSLGESAFRHKCDELTDEFLSNVTTALESPDEAVQ